MRRAFKAPQGVLRTLILAMASRSPVTGTDIIEQLERQTRGEWVPSPGSVYFLVNELKREGLLMSMPNVEEKKYITTSKAQAEISATRTEFKSLLAFYLQLMGLLSEAVEPSEAIRVTILRSVLDAPQDRLARLRASLLSG